FCGGLAGEESGLQIQGESEVEVVFVDVEREATDAVAGVVDENVQLSEMFSSFLNGGRDLSEIGHVHLKRQRLAAHGLNFAYEAGRAAHVAQAEGDVGAGVGQGERDGAAEPAGSSGDKGDLAGEIEAGKLRHEGSSPPRGGKRKRRPVNSQAPPQLLQRKLYLTGSPPSRRGRRCRQVCRVIRIIALETGKCQRKAFFHYGRDDRLRGTR